MTIINEGLVKLPNEKVIDKITNFVIASYLKRNKYAVPKEFQGIKYAVDKKDDMISITLTKKDLPYDLKTPITMFIVANYNYPQYEAVLTPNPVHDNWYMMEFFMKANYYVSEKDNIERLRFKIKTNVRHEFVHLIQNYILADVSDDAKAKQKMFRSRYTAGKANYYTSPVEFESYLVSVIDDFTDKHKTGFRKASDMNAAVRKYVGSADFFKAYKKAATKAGGKKTLIKGYVDDEDDKYAMSVDFEQIRRKALTKFYASKEVQKLIKNEGVDMSFKDYLLSEGEATSMMTGQGYCSVCKKTGIIHYTGGKRDTLKHVKEKGDHFLGYAPGRRRGEKFGGTGQPGSPKKEQVEVVFDVDQCGLVEGDGVDMLVANPQFISTERQPETPRVPSKADKGKSQISPATAISSEPWPQVRKESVEQVDEAMPVPASRKSYSNWRKKFLADQKNKKRDPRNDQLEKDAERQANESEQIDEISVSTAASYATKAQGEVSKLQKKIVNTHVDDGASMKQAAKLTTLVRQRNKRLDGIDRAHDRIYKTRNEAAYSTQDHADMKRRGAADEKSAGVESRKTAGSLKVGDKVHYQGKPATVHAVHRGGTKLSVKQGGYLHHIDGYEAKPYNEETEMNEAVTTELTKSKERPRGIGWELHKLGKSEHTWRRKTKPAGTENRNEDFNLEDFTLEELQEFTLSEEYEQLDELTKKTLGNYIKKASDDQGQHELHVGLNWNKDVNDPSRAKTIGHHGRKSIMRSQGIERAVDKLTKEDVDMNEGEWKKNADGSMTRHSPGEGKGGNYDKGKVTIHKEGHRLHGQVAHVFHRFEDGRVNAQIPHRIASKSINLTLKPGEFKE